MIYTQASTGNLISIIVEGFGPEVKKTIIPDTFEKLFCAILIILVENFGQNVCICVQVSAFSLKLALAIFSKQLYSRLLCQLSLFCVPLIFFSPSKVP